MPATNPVVLVTVIVVVLPAPAANDTVSVDGGITAVMLSLLKRIFGCPTICVGIEMYCAIFVFLFVNILIFVYLLFALWVIGMIIGDSSPQSIFNLMPFFPLLDPWPFG
jgi:hypothetical protein